MKIQSTKTYRRWISLESGSKEKTRSGREGSFRRRRDQRESKTQRTPTVIFEKKRTGDYLINFAQLLYFHQSNKICFQLILYIKTEVTTLIHVCFFKKNGPNGPFPRNTTRKHMLNDEI